MKKLFWCMIAILSIASSCNGSKRSNVSADAKGVDKSQTTMAMGNSANNINNNSGDDININDNKKMNMKTIQLTKAEFLKKVANYETNPNEWKYLGDKPAIIDFYATWCGPCKTLAPVLEELAKEYEGKIYIYKVDTEKEPELSAAFGIKSIPTLIFVPMTGQPQMAVGAIPKKDLKEAIDKVLLNK